METRPPTRAGNERVPLPLHSALDRMSLGGAGQAVREALDRVSVRPEQLQDFRPLTRCLEWELSELHWSRAGLTPFVESDVPFLINNSGRLSEDVAVTLYASCEESDPGEQLMVLELGAGTGLFARYLLDAFQNLCEQEERDYYGRLCYLVTDRSRRAVEQWEERGLFDAHAGRVVTGVCNALKPGEVTRLDGTTIAVGGVRAVLCNYMLDVLPGGVVRQGPGGLEELCVRTHLADDRALLSMYTRLALEEIRDRVSSLDPDQRAELIGLMSLFEVEAAFLPCREAPPYADGALAAAAPGERVVLNHGAIECLEAALGLLEAAGFILVNDYGATRPDEVAGQAATQRFGPTSALGLNFPHLERHFHGRGRTVVVPGGDDEKSIHARLLVASSRPRTAEAFRHRFSGDASRHFHGPIDEARRHLASGRKSDALASYRAALERGPRDWTVVGEVAEFVGLQLRDHAAGLELARAAVSINPWYSTWLWNVLGDCLFLLDRTGDAHEAYLQAQRIDPSDPRTCLNLAFTFSLTGQFREALEAIAAGLARDTRGQYRDRMLEKQQQVLAALAGRWLGEQERLSRRASRLRGDDSPPAAPASASTSVSSSSSAEATSRAPT